MGGTFRMRSLSAWMCLCDNITEKRMAGCPGSGVILASPHPRTHTHFPAELPCKHISTLDALASAVTGLGSHLGSLFLNCVLPKKVVGPGQRCCLFYLNLSRILEMGNEERKSECLWEREVGGTFLRTRVLPQCEGRVTIIFQ